MLKSLFDSGSLVERTIIPGVPRCYVEVGNRHDHISQRS